MATRKSPLRDRLLSNSPDPMKTSILRESGMGWNSPPSSSKDSPRSNSTTTTPLRISKRESPVRPRDPGVARRSSASYKHVRNNNLVSKSPFKSQIPATSTPSRIEFPAPTRRVSGEKRARPPSMHEEAENENDRPFALKRERKQSKVLLGLAEREPVTKSPFKQPPSQRAALPLPPIPSTRPPPPAFVLPADTRTSTPSNGSTSPSRPSLVSRRLLGPRLSGPRERRKTVIFDERCDVWEFSCDEEDSEVSESAVDDNFANEDDHFQHETPADVDNDIGNFPEDSSYESIQLTNEVVQNEPNFLTLDPDSSITGIVDEMFTTHTPGDDRQAMTPPPHDISHDLEAEGGVPYGRSHHAERLHQHHSQSRRPSPQPQLYPFNLNLPTRASPYGPPATPPRRSPGATYSTPPLGRSTHVERVRAAREEEEDTDVAMLPVSPSPQKQLGANRHLEDMDSLIPRFDLKPDVPHLIESEPSEDPFSASQIFKESALYESPLDISPQETSHTDLDHPRSGTLDKGSLLPGASAANVSAEVSSSMIAPPINPSSDQADEETAENPKDQPGRESSCGPEDRPLTVLELRATYSYESEDPLSAIPSRVTTPAQRSPSPHTPLQLSPRIGSPSGARARNSRDDVKERLLRSRRFDDRGSGALPLEADGSGAEAVVEKPYMVDEVTPPQEDDLDSDHESPTLDEPILVDEAFDEVVVPHIEHHAVVGNGEEFGLLSIPERLDFDFGSKFGLGGLGISNVGGSAGSRQSAMKAELGEGIKVGSVGSASGPVRLGDVDVDMEMRSALDRLMDDVAGTKADDSIATEEDEDPSYSQVISKPQGIERRQTDSALLGSGNGNGFVSRNVSGSSIASTIPPPPPPKDNIRSREALILEKRREARQMEEDVFDSTPPKGGARAKLGVGRPSRRRSMSTGDADVLSSQARKQSNPSLDATMEMGGLASGQDPLSDTIERELKKLEGPQKSRYHVREREGLIYAKSEDKVSHMAGPGDVNMGKAWRTVRRPSDMNEYSRQIKEYRAQEAGKAYGKVFVRVLGVKGIHLPIPQEPTALTCTLNNGIHFVTTPECRLARDSRIDQEFELIEHSKLEFTLTLKVRRDPHIISQFKAISPSNPIVPPPPPPVAPTTSRGGMLSFFSSSPKKAKEKQIVPPPPPPQRTPVLVENLARYLKPDGTLARAFISFKEIASRCDTKMFETTYPLLGQRIEPGNKISTLQVGEIVLQFFRLPPLPGVAANNLPQSLEECHRGLRHINWHKVTYFEGTLTQNGGDCSTWRRRQLRVIGANLVAFNDVTKKATATIDLKQAISVEDDQESSGKTARGQRFTDDYEGLFGVERSFRLKFPHDQEIVFFADSDDEKSRWLDVLRALVGHIPPHPLWAELLWQRQEDLKKVPDDAPRPTPQSSTTFPPTRAQLRH